MTVQLYIKYRCTFIVYPLLKSLQTHNYNYMTSCIGVLKYISYVTYHIFKYDCIIVHKAYYLFTCTCVSINSFHSHSHSHIFFVICDFIFKVIACVFICLTIYYVLPFNIIVLILV